MMSSVSGGLVTGRHLGQHTAAFAEGWAEAAGNLREGVGSRKDFPCFLPAALLGKRVPLGNVVFQRAVSVAERGAAVHTATGLNKRLVVGAQYLNFLVVAQPVGRDDNAALPACVRYKVGRCPL